MKVELEQKRAESPYPCIMRGVESGDIYMMASARDGIRIASKSGAALCWCTDLIPRQLVLFTGKVIITQD
jgi:hypothetical protein